MKLICSWSGGKDSGFALWKAMSEGHQVHALFNVMNETGLRSRSHGLSPEVLEAQAKALGLPLHLISSSWENYEENFVNTLKELKAQYQTDAVVFGDIDIKQHRDWEEKVSSLASMEALLPIWQRDRKELVFEMIDEGFEAMIVSCNAVLGENFLGQIIDSKLIEELQAKGVDVCGENGEYHTLLVNAPFFKEKLSVKKGAVAINENYWFLEVKV